MNLLNIMVSWKSKSQNTAKQRTQPQSNKPLQILYDFTYTVVKLIENGSRMAVTMGKDRETGIDV